MLLLWSLLFPAFVASSQPQWVATQNMQYNMQVTSRLMYNNGTLSSNPSDIIASFVGGECRGVASPNASYNGVIFLTVGSNLADGEEVKYKAWLADEGIVVDLKESHQFSSQAEIGTMASPFVFTYDVATDLDGNIYSVVLVGNQKVMGQNLRVSRYRNGNTILTGLSSAEWQSTNQGAYVASGSKSDEYGYLYNFYAVSNELCPDGWHVPSDQEWKDLEQQLGMEPEVLENYGYRGTDQGGQLKSTGTIENGDGLWYAPNTGATNSSGMGITPDGLYDGSYANQGYWAYIWTATEVGDYEAIYRILNHNNQQVARYQTGKTNGFSVRCFKDSPSDLVAYYPLNGDASDQSPNANHGSTSNFIPSANRFGEAGTAVYIDGSNVISAPSSNAIAFGANDFTIGFWFTLDDIYRVHNGLIGRNDFEGIAIEYNHDSDQKMRVFANAEGSGYWDLDWKPSYNGFENSKWYYLVLKRESDGLSFYINAQLIESTYFNITVSNPETPLYIGRSQLSNRTHLGNMDDLRIFNRALTDTEIQDYYYEGGYTPATIPSVSTVSVSNITQNSADVGGSVLSDGGEPVTAHGIIWSNSPNPNFDNNYIGSTQDASLITGAFTFTHTIPDLQHGTTYYVRAYASNSLGTAYGEQLFFTTLSAYHPWTVYDASVLPDLFNPAFVVSSGTFNETENTIVDDAAIAENKLLRMDVNGNPNAQFYWRMNFANHNVDVNNLTVVTRAKGNPERNMALDLDIHYNNYRTRISIHNGTNLARVRNGSGTDTELNIDVTQWNVYRITMNASEARLYINESSTPAMIIAPQYFESTNRHFRLGDGDSGNSFGADIDWVIWDYSGDYAPGQGAAIPEVLSLSPVGSETRNLTFRVTDVNSTPIEDVTIYLRDLSGSGKSQSSEISVKSEKRITLPTPVLRDTASSLDNDSNGSGVDKVADNILSSSPVLISSVIPSREVTTKSSCAFDYTLFQGSFNYYHYTGAVNQISIEQLSGLPTDYGFGMPSGGNSGNLFGLLIYNAWLDGTTTRAWINSDNNSLYVPTQLIIDDYQGFGPIELRNSHSGFANSCNQKLFFIATPFLPSANMWWGGEFPFTFIHSSVTVIETNVNGLANTALNIGNYYYTTEKAGYSEVSGEVSLNEDSQVNLVLESVFSGGNGTAQSPYQISNAYQLDQVRNYAGVDNAGKHFMLINNIDLGTSPWNEGWNPIGSNASRFTGVFNGNGYTIFNLYVNKPDVDNLGLFGYVSEAEFANVKLENINIQGRSRIGALVGLAWSSYMQNCYSTGNINSTGNFIGGLVGVNYNGSTITGCYSNVNIQTPGYSIGGLAGTNEYSSTISNSYSTGSVHGQRNVGGLVGWIYDSNITNSYAVGVVTSISDAFSVGGLVGVTGNTVDSYWNIETTSQAKSNGGVPKTTGEMLYSSTFTNWDFINTWRISEGSSYPWLAWQGSPIGVNYPPAYIPPSNLVATLNASNISLSWNAPSIGSPNGYYIYKDGAQYDFVSGQTTYQDYSVSYNNTYRYQVVAQYEGVYNSNLSNIASLYFFSGFNGGDGTQGNPYLISNAEQLNSVRYYLNSYFLQVNHIDLGVSPWNDGEGWNPIGDITYRFNGGYDGGGYSIYNLYIERPGASYQGLFGFVDEASIQNLNLDGIYINGSGYLGAIAGYVNRSTLKHIYVGATIYGNSYLGGLCGIVFDNSLLEYTSSSVYVSGQGYVGGLVGLIQQNNSNVINSYSGGTVIASNIYGGGLIGGLFNTAKIANSYSTAQVSGGTKLGGLVGYSSNGSVNNSFARGSVSGTGFIGGLIGHVASGSVQNSFSTGAVSGETQIGGLIGMLEYNPEIIGNYWNTESSGIATSFGGEGRSTAQMTSPYDQNTFIDWDFNIIWGEDFDYNMNNGYPYLRMQQGVPPSVITISANNFYIASHMAMAGGNVTNDYGVAVTDRGIIWSTNSNLTLEGNNYQGLIYAGQGVGTFNVRMEPLVPNTTYYYRAFAINTVGYGYGSVLSFTTPIPIDLCVALDNCQVFFTSSGNQPWFGQNVFTSDGEDAAQSGFILDGQSSQIVTTVQGPASIFFNWRVSSESDYDYLSFYINDVLQDRISGEVDWQEIGYSLTAGANSLKWVYSKDGSQSEGFDRGWVDQFRYSQTGLPQVISCGISNLTNISVVACGDVTSEGSSAVSDRGVVWGLSPEVSIDYNMGISYSGTTGTGEFSNNITGLSPATKYYYRAFAINQQGVGYGDAVEFTTDATKLVPEIFSLNAPIIIGNNDPRWDLLESHFIDRGNASINASNSYWKMAWNNNGLFVKVVVSDNNFCDEWCTGNIGSNWMADRIELYFNVSNNLNPPDDHGINPELENDYYLGYHQNTSHFQQGVTQLGRSLTNMYPHYTDYYHAYSIDGSTITYEFEIPWSSLVALGVPYSPANGKEFGFDIKYADWDNAQSIGEHNWWSEFSNGWQQINTIGRVKLNTSPIDGNVTPILTTNPVTSISGNSAISGGNISYDGGNTVTSRGVIWNTSQNPSFENYIGYTNNGSGVGEFVSDITGLNQGVTYYVRAYAINSVGTSYGQQEVFSTTQSSYTIYYSNPGNWTNPYIWLWGGDGSFTDQWPGEPMTPPEGGSIWYSFQVPSSYQYLLFSDGQGGDKTIDLYRSTTGWFDGIQWYDSEPYNTHGTVTDIDGNQYRTIAIGDQVWMAQNLKARHYNNGDAIPTGLSNNDWQTTSSGAVAIYPQDGEIITTEDGMLRLYGAIYNWYAVNDGRNICPSGWRVASYEEWLTLINNYGGADYAGGKLKSTGEIESGSGIWYSPNTGATNESNFLAVPGGHKNSLGDFYNLGAEANWWTYDAYDASFGLNVRINNNSTSTVLNALNKNDGYAVRCIYGTSATIPTVTTNSISSITATSAVSGGNVTSDGGVGVTSRGVVWSTSQNPTIETAIGYSNNGSGTGTFTSNIINLSPSTTYYVRAYATNTVGTAYGDQVWFTTQSPSVPVISTKDVVLQSATTALSGGVITSDGGSTILQKGVVWSTSSNPTVSNYIGITYNGSGSADYNSNITGLAFNTRYYVRAYAQNSIGTAYGNVISFTTANSITFTVFSPSNSTISGALVNLGGEQKYTDANGSAIFYKVAGVYEYNISASGYLPAWGNVTVSDADVAVNIKLVSESSSPPTITGEQNVCSGSEVVYNISGSPSGWWEISGGSVVENTSSSVTVLWTTGNSNGMVSFHVNDGSYLVSYILPISVNTAHVMSVSERPQIHKKGHLNILICTTSNVDYKWFKDGLTLANATGQYYVARQQAGDFKVQVKHSNQCPHTSASRSLSGKSGVQLSVVAYPNPSSGSFTLLFEGDSEGSGLLTIANTFGSIVHKEIVTKVGETMTKDMTMENLLPGVYLITLRLDEQTVATAKLTIQ